jgi:hypothetical protein
MLKAQTYQNFRIIIIGDDYTDPEEFKTLVELFPLDKTVSENNPFSYRNVLKIPRNRWSCGGVLPRYLGVKKALEMKIDYYVHLDDDDTWSENHLQTLREAIEKFPEADVLYTRSKYKKNVLPIENITEMYYNNLPPRSCKVVHSSTCINLKTFTEPLLETFNQRLTKLEAIKDLKAPEESFGPFDIQKWNMINQKIKEGKCKTLFIPKTTCVKLSDVNIP